ncbi:MAG TPA: ankyrin repeat domain-containing protein [Pyrinomonadaceae bacterium]|nr:ankyrin repeat domain-containing protein [Pyrinomonadaceae bacterium]
MKPEFLNAVKEGDEAKVRELLGTNSDLATVTDENGVSAVLQAVYRGHDKIAQVLIASGLKLNIFEASATGATPRVRELLETEPDLVNAFSPDGFTPLGYASFFGHLETVRVLLDKGAQVNVPSNNFLKAVPLRSASVAGHLEIARLLIDRGAEVDAPGGGGMTSLHEVAGVGRVEFAKLLLDHGANINARADDGKTPLTIAIEYNKTEMAEFLRSKGGVQ